MKVINSGRRKSGDTKKVFKTLHVSERSKIVKAIEIRKAKFELGFYLIKLKLTLVDNSILHVNEFLSEETFKYSYHWQDKKGELQVRWDNSPHHKEIPTFPHHKHIGKRVEVSSIHNLEKTLGWIERKIKQKDERRR